MEYFKQASEFVGVIQKFLSIPTAASIIGAVVGGAIGYRSASYVSKREEFNNAAAIFREAFIPERLLLDIRHAPEESSNKTALDIIEPAIKCHIEAMLRFRNYLPWWKRILFKLAWNEYAHYKVKGEPDTPYFTMYGEEMWEGVNTKSLAIKRIDKLLKFASPR